MGRPPYEYTYEWNVHHPLALKAGLKPEIAQAIADGRRPTGMAQDEEVVYDVLTEALQNKSVSDVTYERGVKQFGERNLVDLLAIAGYYAMLAMLLNVARTQLPAASVPDSVFRSRGSRGSRGIAPAGACSWARGFLFCYGGSERAQLPKCNQRLIER